MLKTEHIELALYEGSDFVSYLTTYNETMEKIDASVYDLQSKLNADELTALNLAEIVRALQADMTNAENEIDTLISKCSELDSDILNNTDLINNLQSELTTTNAKVKSLLVDIDNVSEKIANLETNLDGTTERLQTEIQNLAKNLEDFVNEQTTNNAQLQKDIDDLQTKTNSLESIVNQITSALNSNYKLRVKNLPASDNIEFSYGDLEFSITQERGLVGLVISESLENPISAYGYGKQPSIALIDSANDDFNISIGNKTVASGVVCPIISGSCNSNICLITVFIGE